MGKNFTPEQIELFKEAFEIFDYSGKKAVQTKYTGIIIRSIGQNPTEKDIKTYKRKLDPKNKGYFDFPTFMFVLQDIWDESHFGNHDIEQMFNIFDKDNSGSISVQELKHVMTNLGNKLTVKEIDDIFESADLDGNGQLSLEEFKALLKN